jgi:hypothetical protein
MAISARAPGLKRKIRLFHLCATGPARRIAALMPGHSGRLGVRIGLPGMANEKGITIKQAQPPRARSGQKVRRRSEHQSVSLPIKSIWLRSKVSPTTILPICASNRIWPSFLLISADKGNV